MKDNVENRHYFDIKRKTALVISALILGSCGSSNDINIQNETDILQGIFIDSAVQGLSYATATEQGITDETGTFSYRAGETVTFNIGDLVLPSSVGKEILSPVDLASSSTNPTLTTTNIARLLQSIDVDGDTANGITIPANAAMVATALNFDSPIDAFESNPDVINFIANSGSSNVALIPASIATAHLFQSLAEISGAQGESGIAGYWQTSDSNDFISIAETGVVVFYDNDSTLMCHTTRTGTITQIEGTLYLLKTDDGDEQQLVITREGSTLNILLVDSLTLVTDSDPTALDQCT